jgi:HD superfamily phosphohydrolase
LNGKSFTHLFTNDFVGLKQLGFSFYTFPGAEHSRFGHSIGVMFNASEILRSIGFGADEEDLMAGKLSDPTVHYHQVIRLSALLHDIGTFPFSHTTEAAYIRFGETKNKKGHEDDHEHLGSFIIKNTDYYGGITHIFNKYGIDPQQVSNLVKGVDKSYLANQILHSEIDCDRMDYLLRDAHYTGLQYGTYDRDYLMYHFTTQKVGGHNILTIKKNALHCVEDFLQSRFAWYSQVVRSPRGAKYDAIAEELCYYFLEKGYIYKYSELLDAVANDPLKFYTFNDQYFMQLVHKHYTDGSLNNENRVKNIAKNLLFEISPHTVRCDEFKQRLLNQDEEQKNNKIMKKAQDKIKEIEKVLEKEGTKEDWIVVDMPKKDISYLRSQKRIIKSKEHQNVLLERDPVKISDFEGQTKLLVDIENSIMSQIQKTINFIPHVFCSDSAYQLLKKKKIIQD